MSHPKSSDPDPHAFRHRGTEINRLEAFTDAVFAFAVTLLVVSLEVPKSSAELFHAMRGFLAFAICFSFLILIWYDHYRFNRRYGLTDPYTIFLNMVLIFVVLLYVYPMKFLFAYLVDGLVWHISTDAIATAGDMKKLMVIYGFGYLAVSAVGFLMYRHAFGERSALKLSPLELHDTRDMMQRHLTGGAVALLSILIAALSRDKGGFAGLTYMLLGPLLTIQGWRMGRRRRILEESGTGHGVLS